VREVAQHPQGCDRDAADGELLEEVDAPVPDRALGEELLDFFLTAPRRAADGADEDDGANELRGVVGDVRWSGRSVLRPNPGRSGTTTRYPCRASASAAAR
jgi:hypothetical protein